jgi:putative cell wall-binding protein
MAAAKRKWSGTVTETSDAMDVADGTFKESDPKKIARAIEHDAETSKRRKSTPYRSAMSMLTFYMNRAGSNLTAKQRKILEEAKDVLRAEFGPDAKPRAKSKRAPAAKATPRKAGATKSAAAGTKKTAKTTAKKKTAKKK